MAQQPTATQLKVLRQDFGRVDHLSTGYIQLSDVELLLARYLDELPSAEQIKIMTKQISSDPAHKMSFDAWVKWVYGMSACSNFSDESLSRVSELEAENAALKLKITELESKCNSEAAVPSKPDCAKGVVTDAMRERQRRDCNRWCTTMGEWCEVIDHIVGTQEYSDLKAAKWSVSMYDAANVYVKPWTKGSGVGLAVAISKHVEQDAKLMLSHAWGEDIVECKEALVSFFEKYQLPYDDTVWFCVWANYQAGDSAGPSVGEQLAMDPFKAVITSAAVQPSNGGHGMVCIHTSQADLYTRLWCVYEVDAATQYHGVVLRSAMSNNYTREMVRRVQMFMAQGTFNREECLEGACVNVRSIGSKCGSADDEKLLVEDIKAKEGGFKRLDAVVQAFRMRELPQEVQQQLGAKLTAENQLAALDEDLVFEKFEDEDGKMVCGNWVLDGINDALTYLETYLKQCNVDEQAHLIPLLVEKLKYVQEDNDNIHVPPVRCGVLNILETLPCEALEPVVPQLLTTIECDHHEDVCLAAVRVLHQLTPDVLATKVIELGTIFTLFAGTSLNTQRREALAELFGQMPAKQLHELAPKLFDISLREFLGSNRFEAKAAAVSLGKLPPDMLLKYVDDLAEIKMHCADNAGSVQFDPRYQSEDELVTCTFGTLPCTEEYLGKAVPALMRVLANAYEPNVRLATLDLLYKAPQLRPEDLEYGLFSYPLKDDHAEVRLAVMRVLLKQFDALAILPEMAERYTSLSPYNRETDERMIGAFSDMQMAALESINNLSDDADFAALIRLVACPNPALRQAVMQRCVEAQLPEGELFKVVSAMDEVGNPTTFIAMDGEFNQLTAQLMGQLSIGKLMEAVPDIGEGLQQLPGVDFDTLDLAAPSLDLVRRLFEMMEAMQE